MKENNKQELSYFRLKLRSYMSEHHPEKLHDTEFITTRADMALTAYCDAVAQGFSHLEAENIASEVLYQGLHFSKYNTLVSVLENEFERELPAPLPEKPCIHIVVEQGCSSHIRQVRFDGHHLPQADNTTVFTPNSQARLVLLTKSNHLPIIGQTEG